jgi:hypothetical protein
MCGNMLLTVKHGVANTPAAQADAAALRLCGPSPWMLLQLLPACLTALAAAGCWCLLLEHSTTAAAQGPKRCHQA